MGKWLSIILYNPNAPIQPIRLQQQLSELQYSYLPELCTYVIVTVND